MTAKPTIAAVGVTPITYRPVLVGLACAAVELGVTPETVVQLAEAGSLRFVFDLAVKGAKRRALRFWICELRQTGNGAAQTIDAALAEIAGPATNVELLTRTVSARLQTTRTVIHALLARGELRGRKEKDGRQWVNRQSLLEFLARRLVK